MSIMTATKVYGIVKPGDKFEIVGRVANCFEVKMSGDYRNWLIPMWVFV